MARYTIDAITLVHLVEDGVRVNSDHHIVAPNRIRSDALSLLLEMFHRGEISSEQAGERHTRMTALKMRLLGDRVSRRAAWDIALLKGWSTIFESEYLAIAKLQADALVTIDPAMREKAAGIVPIGAVEALVS